MDSTVYIYGYLCIQKYIHVLNDKVMKNNHGF